MILLRLQTGVSLQGSSEVLSILREVVESLEQRPDVRRVYWGSGLEKSEMLHLHIGTSVSSAFSAAIRLTCEISSQGETSPALRLSGFASLCELEDQIRVYN